MHNDGWTPDVGTVIERWHDGADLMVPVQYAIQVYVQLAASELPWNDLCALVMQGGWLAVRWVRFLRDPEIQDEIVETIAAWRQRHLIDGEEPAIDGSSACTRFLASKFVARPTRRASDGEETQMRALAALKAQKKAAEKQIKLFSNELVALANGSRLTLGDDKAAPYGQPRKIAGKVTVDAKKLRADHPDAYAACMKTGQPSATFATYRFAEEEEDDDE